jgi:Concanavalin A-like lectin/glucanases superfamily
VAYRGVTARLPIGAQGFTGTLNQSQAGPGHLTYTEGAELDGGIIRKDGGARLLVQIGSYTSIRTLLHFDNALEGSTTMTDDGFLPGTWNPVGGAKTTLLDKVFGLSALTLNGTTDWINTLSLGVSTFHEEFTIHTRFKCLAPGGTRRNIFGQCDAAGSIPSTSILCYRDTANHIVVSVGQGTSLLTMTGTVAYSSTSNPGWHHLAVERQNDPLGDKLLMFVDGVQQAMVPITGDINSSSASRSLGQCGSLTTNPWQGLFDEFVLKFGTAIWDTNFSPPTKQTPKYGAGAEPPFDTPLPIISGTSWSPGVGLDEDVIMLDNGSVLCDPGRVGDFEVISKEGLTSTREPPPYFCVGGGEDVGQPRKLFLFSKTNQAHVRLSNATIFNPITTPPADWAGGGNFPTFGCLHMQRIFAGGNASDPHRIYYSSIADHQIFTGGGTGAAAAGTMAIFPGQGEKIIGAYSIRGALIVWKYPVGVYIIQTQDPDPTTWQINILSRAVGGLNCSAILQIENDVLYMDHNGAMHLLSATTDFGDFNTSNLSQVADMAPFMKNEVNRGKIQRSQGLYYTYKRQAWFFVPRTNSDICNLRLQVAFPGLQQQQQQGGSPPRFFMSRRDDAGALWLRPSNLDGTLKPTIGTEDGCIFLLDDDNRTKYDGSGYPIEFTTANTDLAFMDPNLATRHKNGQFLELVYEPEGEWDLLVDVFWDDIYTDTLAFNMGGAGGVLGYMVLGVDVIGSSGVRSSRKRLPGSGRRYRMTCFNDGPNQNVSISEFHLSFGVGDERTAE